MTGDSSGLTVDSLCAGYGGRVVVRDIGLSVHRGKIALLSGANGAGKSTLLHCISGRLPSVSGTICIDGQRAAKSLERRAQQGVVLVPEERSIFKSLTVSENLRLAGRNRARMDIFPELQEHLGRPAGLLSGGQQQLLALARALSCGAKYLLVDELTLGLAPLAIQRLLDRLREVVISEGIGVLLVEQHVRVALGCADWGAVLSGGTVSLSGDSEYLRHNLAKIEDAYLGGLNDAPASSP